MKLIYQTYFFLLILSNTLALIPISSNPIYPAQSTRGAITTYMFSFLLSQNISNNATLQIGFPSEYNYTIIASNMACKMRNQTSVWVYYSCSFEYNKVIIAVKSIYAGNTYLAIQNVTNPQLYNISSEFSIYSVRGNITIQAQQSFGEVIFCDLPINNPNSPIINSLSSNIVYQGSSYQFKFNLTHTYPANTTIRINFPPGFSTNFPICKIAGLVNQFNQVIPTFVLANNRSIECRYINKTLLNQSLTIIGIYNPQYSGTFFGGLIEIIQVGSTIILETIQILSSISILPGPISTKIISENNFVLSTNIYTFYINLFSSLNSTDYIQIRFPLTWNLYENECQAKMGFTFLQNQKINCYNYTDGVYKYLNITGFFQAQNSVQQILLINLTTPNPSLSYTPPSSSNYQIEVSTWNYQGMMDMSTNTIDLNSTYGTINMTSVDAIQFAAKLPVGKTGPLELTFFLNYDLFQTNVITNGTLIITIIPQIPQPVIPINGILKCFFFMTYQASQCDYDNSNINKTVITIMTPQTRDFQYSEIPITITTEGAINESQVGLTISPYVQRYLFQCYFYTYRSNTIPTQVFFSEFIAYPLVIPIITANTVDQQSGQWTHIQINVTMPYNFTKSTYVFKISFEGTAWASALGYTLNSIIQDFPCTVIGSNATTNFVADPPQCDLYTYTSGGYTYLNSNGQQTSPYILIYGFQSTLETNDTIKIQIPGILIASPILNYSSYTGNISFSIMQQTPGMLQPYVQLYYRLLTLFTLKPPSLITGSTISLTPNPPTNSNLSVQSDYIFNLSWINPIPADTIIYRLNFFNMPSLLTSNANCNSVNNSCVISGLPVNWIVIYYNPAILNSVVSTVPNGFITNPPSSGNFVCQAIAYANGLIIEKANFIVNYTPNIMTLSTFTLDSLQNQVYYGLEHYYTISFVPVTSLQNNCFIRLIFSNINLGNLAYCASTVILPLDTQGILCIKQSSSSLKIYNIKGLIAGTMYIITVRLVAPLNAINQSVSIYLNYLNSATTDPSITDQETSIMLNPILNYLYNSMKNFEILNPRTIQMTQKINYIGPLSIAFKTPITIYPITNIQILLYPHQWNGGFWTTPNNIISDPVVCRLNNVRVQCQWNFLSYTPPVQLAPVFPLNILSFTLTIPTGLLSSTLQNIIRIQTQYLNPYNGIKYPSQAGLYLTQLLFSDSMNFQPGGASFYTRVDPDVLQSFYVSSTVDKPNQQTLFIVEFTVKQNKLPFPNLNTLNTYSRIFIQFPTIDEAGNTLFTSNFGGYSSVTGQFVGCAFNANISNYVSAYIASNPMKCRLILSQNQGQPVRIQIINFGAFTSTATSMQIFIGRGVNPQIILNSFQIAIQIQNVDKSTNLVSQIYRDYFDLFFYPRNTPLFSTIPSSDSSTSSFFNSTGGDVGDSNGIIRLVAQTVNTVMNPFYFFVILPSYLKVQNNQIVSYTPTTCPPSNFIWCINLPEINYIIVYCTSNNSEFYATLVNYPYSISQTDSIFNGYVWQDQSYIGIVPYNISSTRWKLIQGTINYVTIDMVGLTDKNARGRLDSQITINFMTTNTIFVNGSIQIRFPSRVTSIQPHCRSATTLGSALVSSAGNFGQIGCMVQIDTNGILSWVITGFATLVGPANIIIYGKIDMPTSSGPLGIGQIITYIDQDNTNIYKNGSRIDYTSTNFGLTVNNSIAFNANPQITMYQTLPLRTGYVGSLRLLYTCDSSFIYKTGVLQIRLNQNSIFGKSGGFSSNPAIKKVCEFMNTATNEKLGCIVSESFDSTLSHQSVIYRLSSSTTLLSGNTYLITITTQTGSGLATEGLIFPIIAGIYKIDINIDLIGAGSFNYHNQLYLQVYGKPFNLLNVTSFVTIPAAINLIWVQMIPNIQIDNTNHIVIQFPIKASDNTTLLFDEDLGMGYQDYQQIPVDIFDSPNYDGVGQFWQCNFFMGSITLLRPSKIICGNLQLINPITSISPNNILRFALKIKNPSIGTVSQISLPVIIYTYDPTDHIKTNFNLIDNAIFLRNGTSAKVHMNFATVYNQLQTYNETLSFSTYNPTTLLKDDYYLLLFSFPIRVNGFVANGCKLVDNTIVGDLYYHWYNRAAVCHVTTSIGIQNSNISTPNLMFMNFYTPWYKLTQVQQFVTGYASYISSLSITIQVNYLSMSNDNYALPLLGARTNFPLNNTTPESILQIDPVLGHLTLNQLDDYMFTIALQSSSSLPIINDLQYCKAISIIFPSSSNMKFWNSDCIQSTTSTIEVDYCWLDLSQNTLFIYIVQKSTYLNTDKISVVTRNLAIQNPNISTTINSNQFKIQFYSWENQSNVVLSSISPYLQLDNSNIISNIITFVPVSIQPFYFAYFPYQRYYSEFTIYQINNQYAPFQFDIIFDNIIPTSAINQTLTIFYGSSFTTNTPILTIQDLYFDKPVCYFDNNRIQNCVINDTAKTVTMTFDFIPLTNTPINVYASMLDPKDSQINGFKYTGSRGVYSLRVQYFYIGLSNPYSIITPPFNVYQTQGTIRKDPYRCISAVSAVYGHTIQNQLNVINLKITFNDLNAKGLVFQFPMVDEFLNPIFTSTSFFGLTDGSPYPCGNGFNQGLNSTSTVKCFIQNGDMMHLGMPTRIYMTDFVTTLTMNCRLLLYNPVATKWLSIKIKAYNGLRNHNSIYGQNYLGYFDLMDILQSISASPSTIISGLYSNDGGGTYYFSPTISSQLIWRDNNKFTLNYQIPNSSGVLMQQNQITILQIPLKIYNTSLSQQQVCSMTIPNSFPAIGADDILYLTLNNNGNPIKKAFAVFTWTSTDITNNFLNMECFKCKYFDATNVIFIAYYFSSPIIYRISHTILPLTFNNLQIGGGYINTFDIAGIDGSVAPIQFQIDLTTAINDVINTGFNFILGTSHYLLIIFQTEYWSDITNCQIYGGVSNTWDDPAPFCKWINNTALYVTEFDNMPMNQQLNKYRLKIGFTSNYTVDILYNITVKVSLYSNKDAYTNVLDPIFYFTTANLIDRKIPSITIPNYSAFNPTQLTNYSTFEISKISSTSNSIYLECTFTPITTFNFPANSQVYFTFYISNYNPNFTSSVNSAIIEFNSFKVSIPQSDITITTSTNAITISCSDFDTQTYAGSSWSNYDSSDSLSFYFNISSTADQLIQRRDWIGVGIIVECNCSSTFLYNNYAIFNQLGVQQLASSANIGTKVANDNAINEFYFVLTNMNTQIGVHYNKILLIELMQSIYSDPFRTYNNNTVISLDIECQCQLNGIIASARCIRRLPQGIFNNVAITIEIKVEIGDSLNCFFPQFTNMASTSLFAQFKAINIYGYPDHISSNLGNYGGYFSMQSNVISFTSNPIPNDLIYSSTDQIIQNYASGVIGTNLTNPYNLTIIYETTTATQPYIYINFGNGGPVPLGLCTVISQPVSQCRTYTTYKYILTAKLSQSSLNVAFVTNSQYVSYPPYQFYDNSPNNVSYQGIIYVDNGLGYYIHSGPLKRSQQVQTKSTTFFIESDLYGTNKAGYPTNIIITFNMQGQQLYSKNTGSKIKISWNISISSNLVGCLVFIDNDINTVLDCQSYSNYLELTIKDIGVSYSTAENLYVVMGIINPITNPVQFILQIYSYEYATSIYAITVSQQALYLVDIAQNLKNTLSQSYINMYDFNTRVNIDNSNVLYSPLRFYFRLSQASNILKSSNSASFTLNAIIFNNMINYECYFKQYANFMNLMQHTQYAKYQSICSCTTNGTLQLLVPKSHDIDKKYYYELIVYPIGNPAIPGFTSGSYNISITALDTTSTYSQTIQTLFSYPTYNIIQLVSLYTITTQPLSTTSIQLTFNINRNLLYYFPQHWIQIIFFDLDTTSWLPYIIGDQIPCTIRDDFTSASVYNTLITNPPRCILNKYNNNQDIYKVKLEGLGKLIIGQYIVTIDDFQFPDISILSEQTKKFDIAIAYINPTDSTLYYYERYFPEILLQKGNNLSPPSPVLMTFTGPSSTQLGASTSFNLTFLYPFSTLTGPYNDYKMTIRFNGGFSNTQTISNFGFSGNSSGYTILWSNTINNLVVLKMNSNLLQFYNQSISVTGIINPYPYQSFYFANTNLIQTNFYNSYMLTATANNVTQPLYTYFTALTPQVNISLSFPSNSLDIYPAANKFPIGMQSNLLLIINVGQNAINLSMRQLTRLQIVFTNGVTSISNCWVNLANGSYYLTDSQCQVLSGTLNPTIQLYGFNDNNGRVTNGLQLLIQLEISGSLSYITTLYAANNQIQYSSTTGSVSMILVNSSLKLPTIFLPELKYVINYFEYQIRYLFAIPNQETPVLKFRFINPVTLIYASSVLNIYPPLSSFRNILNLTNMICTFIPTLLGYHQYGIGVFSPCSLNLNYIIPAPFGDLLAGAEYLLHIRQNNVITSNFVMPNTPIRDEIILQSNLTGLLNRDNLVINAYASFSQTNILHTTMTVSQLNTITVLCLTPFIVTPIASQQLILTLSLNSLYYNNNTYNQADLGIMKQWQLDTLGNFVSGYNYPLNVIPINNTAASVISFGQYNLQFSPILISLSMQGGYSNIPPSYQWKIPLLANPSIEFVALSYNLTLYQYTSASAAPIILSFYSIINQYYTVANIQTSLGVSVINSNNKIQSNSVDLKIDLNNYSPLQNYIVQMKWDNSLYGLLTFTSLIQSCSTDSNYTCYFFPTINLLQFQKNNILTYTSIYLSTMQVSNLYTTDFGFKWIKVQTSNISIFSNPYTLYNDSPNRITLTTITSLPTPPTITLLEGLQNIGSTALYLINFTSPIIPDGGQIDLFISSPIFKFPNPQVGYLGDQCFALLNFYSTNENRVLRCYADKTNNKYVLGGFDLIPVNTQLSLIAYLTVNQYTVSSIAFNFNIYGQLYNLTQAIIYTSIPSTITLISNLSMNSFYTLQQYYMPYYSSTYSDIEGSFVLNTISLSNPDQLQIDYLYTYDSLYASQRLIYRQNKTITNSDWIQATLNLASTLNGTYTIPLDQLLSNTLNINKNYIFRLSTYFSPTINNYLMGSVGQVYKFWLKSLSAGLYQQIYYYQLINPPIPQNLTVVNKLPTASNQTMLQLTFTLNIAVIAGDFIQINFDTSNQLYNMFPNDLQGLSVAVNGYSYLDCQQAGTNIISPTKLVCLLYYGNNLANPPIPAIMHIPITNNIAASTTITILIANVQNPNTSSLVSGVFLQVQRICRNSRNQNCPVYSAYGYYITQGIPILGTNYNFTNQVATWSAVSNIILDINVTHTFTFNTLADIQTSDIIYILYPENYVGVMSSVCTVSGHMCYSFNLRNWIVIIPKSKIYSGLVTLSIQNLNNGYYAAPTSLYFKIVIARSTNPTLVFSQIFYANHTDLNYITTTPNTIQNTLMNIVPTQTSPNMLFLRNYDNTVIITIDYLWVSVYIQAFYITAPSDISTWDPNYCNATLQANTIIKTPYPYRLICGAISGNTLQILIPSTVPQYNLLSQTYSIVVNAKFNIVKFPAGDGILYVSNPDLSGYFYAYGSASATSFNTNYYISQASTRIFISQYRIPLIGKITFNTLSFSSRKAQTNQICMFYMLIDPTTAFPVDKFKFYLPVEFAYPPLSTFNNCFLQGSYYNSVKKCYQTRISAQTVMTMDVVGYNNGPRILQLANWNWNNNNQNSFTAPSYPGDFYNITIQMYSTSTLVQKQTVNISPVWGAPIPIAAVNIQNGLDALANQIYDVTFTLGLTPVPPGYYVTGTNMSSQIQIIFQNINGWTNDLGLGVKDGQQIGCFIISGLQPSPDGIKCLLHIGTSYIDQPMIRIINYMTINASTTVMISIANILNMGATIQNTAYVAIMLLYHNIQSEAYLYMPTPKLISATSTLLTSGLISASINYIGNNVVLIPSTLNISLILTYNILISDYIVLTFPKNIIDPYNPTNYTCVGCTTIQVYYLSGIVRIYPALAGNTLNFSINNFSISSYAINTQSLQIKIDAYSSNKIINTNNVSILLNVEKCRLIQANILFISSIYGADLNVTYVFSFIPNVIMQKNGAFSITIPQEYGNLLTNQAYCNVSLVYPAYCAILTPYRIDIYLNGTILNPTSTYLLNVTGLINPNMDVSGLMFTITSYYDDNIYANHIVCQNDIIAPAIIMTSVRQCSLSVNLDYYNTGYNSSYNFLITCNDVIQQNSTLYIYLNSTYNLMNLNFMNVCSSYEITTLSSPFCQLSYFNQSYVLIVSILSSASQISFTIQTYLINPPAATYTFYAQFTNQKILLYQTNSYQIQIFQDTYDIGYSNQIQLYNNPRGAGTQSFYIFKIESINMTNMVDIFTVNFPSNFMGNLGNEISVSVISTSDANLFSKFTYVNLNQICSNQANNLNLSKINSININVNSIKSEVSIQGLKVFLSTTPSNYYIYYIIQGVINPSLYINQTFTFSYSLSNQTNTILAWVLNTNLVYYISFPPSPVIITNISVSDYDTLVPATYTFNINSSHSIISSNQQLAIIIEVPIFYNDTFYVDNNLDCAIYLPIVTKVNCTMYGNELTILWNSSSSFIAINNFSITVNELYNPSADTICNTTDIQLLSRTLFKIKIINMITNQITYQSSANVNISNCLTFTSERIPILISYQSNMISGLIYNFTFGLNVSTSNLRIVPHCSNSNSILFNPSIIQFNNNNIYNITVSIIIGSNINPGIYWIYFDKYQSTLNTIYKPLLPVAFHVINTNDTNNYATIGAKVMTYSYVGYPIVVPIILSIPSANTLTLTITVKQQQNNNLVNYSDCYGNYSISPRVITILPGIYITNFTILYFNTTVPPPITLSLKLSSFYPIIYNLTTPTLYITFYKDPTYQIIFPPMKVIVSTYPQVDSLVDQGKTILNVFINNYTQNASNIVTPAIINISINNIGSTFALINVYTKAEYTVYYAILQIGYSPPMNYSQLIYFNFTNSINSGSLMSFKNSSNLVNCVGIVNATNLQSSSAYNLFAVAFNSMGYSTVSTFQFNTTQISAGVQMKITLNQIQTPLTIVHALKETLGIAGSRIKVITSTLDLANISSNSSTNNLNYTYTVIIGPNPIKDNPSPYTLISNFIDSTTLLAKFSRFLPSWVNTISIPYKIYHVLRPKILKYPTAVMICLYNATFTVQFWSQSKVYAVLIQNPQQAPRTLNFTQQPHILTKQSNSSKIFLTSKQIKNGKDINNNILNKDQIYSGDSDINGIANIYFDGIKPGKSYSMYITGGCLLPYQPTYLMNDSEVVRLDFYTLYNLNLDNSEIMNGDNKIMSEMMKLKPRLAEAIIKFIKQSNLKQDK